MFVSYRTAQMEYQEQRRALPFSIENILREDFPPPSRLRRQLHAASPEEFHGLLMPQPSLSPYGCSFCNCLVNPVRLYLNSHTEGQEVSEEQLPRFVRVPFKLGVERKQKTETEIERVSAQVLPEHATEGTETTETKDEVEVQTAVPTTKKKRFRSHFSLAQLQYLEAVFSRQQYLSRDERSLLASALGMTELQIRNWFQNRRYQQRHRPVLARKRVKQVPVRVLVQE